MPLKRITSLNGTGRRPTSLLDPDVVETGAGGGVCEIDCVRLARFGRFVAVEDGMRVVARSGRFPWPATDTTAPQSESAESRLEALCDELRREGWEQRATGSGRAWYAHLFFPGGVPALPGDEASTEPALESAPGSASEHEEADSGEPVLNGHQPGPTPDDEVEQTPPEEVEAISQPVQQAAEEDPEDRPQTEVTADDDYPWVESNPQEPIEVAADPETETFNGFELELDEPAPAQPWYVAPRATHATLSAHVVSKLCDRVTAYTSSTHQ